MHHASMARPIITKPTLLSDLRSLGVGDFTGSAVMVHTQMSALGTVIGGAQTVVEALIEVLGRDGALLVLTGSAHLLPGRPLLEHAVSWMESHFGEGP